MIVATWNINGANSRIDQLVRWSEAVRPDVLCLQETKTVDSKFPARKLINAGFEHVAFTGEKSYNGVAILSRLPIENVLKSFPRDKPDAPKRLIAADIGGVRIINVYIPHGTTLGSDKFKFKLDWIKRLRKYLDKNCETSSDVLLCGDLNVAPHENDVWNVRHWQDRMHFTKPEREAIRDLKQWGFVDVFRSINDDAEEYSWWDYFHHSFEKDRGLRIDHIWTSKPLAERCIDCWIDREPRGWEHPSDHAPVVAEFIG